jgi:hypothetical protein
MTAIEYQLAQLNIARLAAPLDSAQLADFVAGLDPINALADGAPGFVWRFQDESGDATSFRFDDDPDIIVNMSVWVDYAALRSFVYDTDHRRFLARRREFFNRLAEAYAVLWWVPAGHQPTLAEARERLYHLRRHGATPYAFPFKDGADYPPLGASALLAAQA